MAKARKKTKQPRTDEDTLRNLILLVLPLLSLQRDVLEIARKYVSDAGDLKPTENFALRQFQALMMILDPSRKLRNSLDSDFEKKIENAYKELIPKASAASLQLIAAHDAILGTMFDALNTLRKAKRSKDSN